MEKTKVFLLGFISSLLLMVIVGAGPSAEGPGRYQISAGGNQGAVVVAVLDTYTGEVAVQNPFAGETKRMNMKP